MELNDQLQRQILQHLKSVYPKPSFKIMQEPFTKDPDFYSNLVYLGQEGLLFYKTSSKKGTLVEHALITQEGIDYLEADGGIGRIKKTVHVVIDPKDLLALLGEKIRESDLPAAEKRTLLENLKSFSKPVLQDLLGSVLKQLLGV